MDQLIHDLQQCLPGEVRSDRFTRTIYSVDASIYEVEPLAVVAPRTVRELVEVVKVACQHRAPVIPRGAATGITGGCLGRGVIVDTSMHLNKILEVNVEKKYALCEAGVVQDRLNEALDPLGYRLGPDTSTGNRATLGGMLANNAAGAHSLLYGTMADHIEELELVLAPGEKMRFGLLSRAQQEVLAQEPSRQGRLIAALLAIAKEYGPEIQQRIPKLPRRVSGYNLDALLEVDPLNLCRLIAGSEGTLGIISRMKLRICPKPRHTGLCLLFLDQMLAGLQQIEALLAHRPMALEMIDGKIIEAARHSPAVRQKIGWLQGDPQAVFVAEFAADSPAALSDKMQTFCREMQRLAVGYAHTQLTDQLAKQQVWEVRKAGLGLLLSKRSYNRAIAFIEDLSIPPAKLAGFMHTFQSYLQKQGKEAGIYGHIGSGCMHIRPYIDLRKPEELQLMQQIMRDVSQMVLDVGGALSGEHGDGLVRSWLNEKMFGSRLYEAFIKVKEAFDPDNLINPGKIVHPSPVTQDLRLAPDSTLREIPTFLDFSKEGGLELAADLCNGNAQCRKMETVMCPSFQASGNEYDTTRARAQSLRAVIHGKLPLEALTSKEMMQVLDLCIECKGCKTECPSQVDMAKMKAEVLYQYQKKHRVSLRNWLFGNLHLLVKMASPLASYLNWLVHSSQVAKTALRWVGITRPLPLLAVERFSVWFQRQPQQLSEKKVYLFNDTYTEFHQPEVGQAAYQLLQSLGYQVLLIDNQCCGRPLISKGMLEQAKRNAYQLLQALAQSASESTSAPILLLEPSCISALRDDFQGLLGAEWKDHQPILERCQPLEQFLLSEMKDGKLPLSFKGGAKKVLVHTHCHQKALGHAQAVLQVLRSVEGFKVEEISAGCCGMAGSFGYEKEHDAFSMKIGELKLFPAIRHASKDTLIVADGFSCRAQILHGTGRRALHFTQVLGGAAP